MKKALQPAYHENGQPVQYRQESDFSLEKSIRLSATEVSNDVLDSGVLIDTISSDTDIQRHQERIMQITAEADAMRNAGTLEVSNKELFADLISAREVLAKTDPIKFAQAKAQADVLSRILEPIEGEREVESRIIH